MTKDTEALLSYAKFDGVGLHAETIETRASIGERFLECYYSALDDPLLKGYTPADCPSEIVLDMLERLREALATPASELGFDPTAEVGDEVFPHDTIGNGGGLDPAASDVALLDAAKVLRERGDRVKDGWHGFYIAGDASFDSKVADMLEALAHPPHPTPVDPVAGGEALREALEPFAKLARPINDEEGRPTYLEAISGPNGTDELQLSTYVGDGTRFEILDAEDFRRANRALAALKGPAA